ncbi:asparagine synthase (glutamine-hydrolysing) [Mucilaginibacter oryzae]|uniref:asparagine synthase (glutamine-hydrolyzing) n=1 Tax=Mucilaginibacter oryzae TaxID=468058 RepID=A0A316HF75_9SPHI|nr:asparagine synthase (glutamine-hydrolyzing) [Mucilaginibacter oryzae]PWK79854.1 asparagine synthase (glutamine-hydrolysing) [Mucilaginibacter oryzae]
MCRIAGIVSGRLPIGEIRDKVNQMCRAQQHGGPDGDGVFYDENVGLAFGHRRLSIIDLSSNGSQPMADHHQKARITFNGEIYNYPDLKIELLQSGAKFKSDSDTEVILQAYVYWGTAAFSKLKGMFAFALYDIEKNVTYLVRDTAGIKPLYYATANQTLVFASEVRAFKAAGLHTENDGEWQIRLLAFGNIPEPYTTLKNVFSLPKGHFLSWDNKTAGYTLNSYCADEPLNTVMHTEEARQLINFTLNKSVKRQLVADAPIGVFLSGGIDSSLIALLANQYKKEQLKTISIFFDEKSYDERAYQQIICGKINGQNFSHLVKQGDFENAFPQVMKAMDMPTTDGINSWFISKYAHENGLKAVLSGIGADELFGGYPSFKRIKYLGYLRKLPGRLLRSLSFLAPGNYKRLSLLGIDHPVAAYLVLRGLFLPEDIAAILDTDTKHIKEVLFSSFGDAVPDTYDNEHASWFETELYMQNQLLRDTDVMSMSHGLEVRVPFLDEDFTRAAKSVAPSIRFNAQQPKKLLIDSFSSLLPTEIWSRPKMGFTFPLQNWMTELDQMSDINSFKGKKAREIITKFKNNNLHWSKAFALYQVQNHG